MKHGRYRTTPGMEVDVLKRRGHRGDKFRIWVEEVTFPDSTAQFRMRVVFPTLTAMGSLDEEEEIFWFDSKQSALDAWEAIKYSTNILVNKLYDTEMRYIYSAKDKAFLTPSQFFKKANGAADE